MLGYILLLWQEGGYNASLHRIMLVDLAGILCLAAAAVLKFLSRAAA
jgi:hypothetical protein